MQSAAVLAASAPQPRPREERYRKLLYYMPIALWEVDASAMRPVFHQLKLEGVDDLDAYLLEHPEPAPGGLHARRQDIDAGRIDHLDRT